MSVWLLTILAAGWRSFICFRIVAPSLVIVTSPLLAWIILSMPLGPKLVLIASATAVQQMQMQVWNRKIYFIIAHYYFRPTYLELNQHLCCKDASDLLAGLSPARTEGEGPKNSNESDSYRCRLYIINVYIRVVNLGSAPTSTPRV